MNLDQALFYQRAERDKGKTLQVNTYSSSLQENVSQSILSTDPPMTSLQAKAEEMSSLSATLMTSKPGIAAL